MGDGVWVAGDSIESLLVNLKSDEAEGWGECAPAPLPLYNTEYTKGRVRRRP